MKISNMLLGTIAAVAVLAVLLLVLGVRFQRPLGQGAALYDPSQEVLLKGVVKEIKEFPCPVSEGEVGSHLLLQTANGVVQVHLAPGRVLRSQNLRFTSGEQLEVLGSKVAMELGSTDLIAREITRGNESLVFRDQQGKLLLTQ
jgi:hypothetical protein